MDTLESLRDRVAELEREKDERRRGLQTMQDIVNEAVSAREAAERDLREMTAAKERATEAYRQAEQQRFSAEAKLAGLLEAVGPFVAQERVFLSKFPSTTPDDTRWWDRACLTFWDSRKLIAAYDAAK